jgi:hypothetical protein
MRLVCLQVAAMCELAAIAACQWDDVDLFVGALKLAEFAGPGSW